MFTVIHTINGRDQDRILADIRRGLASVDDVGGFKFASINKQQDTDDIVVVSKWADAESFEHWTMTVGENKAFKQATPQTFEVVQEYY